MNNRKITKKQVIIFSIIAGVLIMLVAFFFLVLPFGKHLTGYNAGQNVDCCVYYSNDSVSILDIITGKVQS